MKSPQQRSTLADLCCIALVLYYLHREGVLPRSRTTTMQPIATAALHDLITEFYAAAQRANDAAAIRQLDKLISAIYRGAEFAWTDGVLSVTSPNSGNVYTVTRAGCNCENAKHGRSQCWHIAARNICELLVREQPFAIVEVPSVRQLGKRIAVARAALMGALL